MDRRVKYGWTLLLLLIAGLLLYGYFYHRTDQAPHGITTTSIPISAADLISLSDKNEALFNRKYLYKVLSVRGVVREVRKTRNGIIVLLEGQHALPEAVSCSLDTLYTHLPELQPGDSCTILGNCAGRLQNVILLQCIVEK
jgi:hypothetical protein